MEAKLTPARYWMVARWATAAYFLTGAVEIYFEMQGDRAALYWVKPLLMPLLLLVYLASSRVRDASFLAMLAFSWIANILFISPEYPSIFAGSMFFFVFRVFSIYIVYKYCGPPKWFPLLVSCIPFLFVYLYLTWHVHHLIGDGLAIFIGQCLLITFLGGLALANYILISNRANLLLLGSTLLFAATQFIFAGMVVYHQDGYFHALAMSLYIPGQYLFMKFVLAGAKSRSSDITFSGGIRLNP